MSNNGHGILIPYFPDGRPVPYLLTLEELCEFIRLETAAPRQSIDRYRRLYGLKAVRVGKRRFFALPDVLKFIEEKAE